MTDIEALRAAIRSIENGSKEPASFDPQTGCSQEPKRSVVRKYDDAHSQAAFAENGGLKADADEAGSESSRAFNKIARLIAISERSSAQLRQRLIRDGFDASDAEEALERAQACGLVDDMRYAEWLVRSRLRQGRGLSGIERELSEAGMALEDLNGWPDEFLYDPESETDRALAFLERHPPKAKDIRGSAYRKLVSKGFSASSASSASRIWCERM